MPCKNVALVGNLVYLNSFSGFRTHINTEIVCEFILTLKIRKRICCYINMADILEYHKN